MAKAVATVDDFNRLANEMGLVPMTHLLDTITERVGDIRGYSPYTALRMYNEGLAEPTKGTIPRAPAGTAAPAESDDDKRKTAVEIPDDWSDSHGLTKVTLAKKIVGNDASLTFDQADQIVADEVQRRAARAAAGPSAVTSASLRT